MMLRVGTSGFSYKEWKGSFYPASLKNAEMLAFYAGKLRTVELNNTFYRLPRASQLEAWQKQVDSDFQFVLKASRRITHFSKLKNCADTLGYLISTARHLGDNLGPLLFQLPPTLRADREVLGEFLELVPKDIHAAFEFRHPSWFEEPIFELLREHDAALCGGDAEDADQSPPLVVTAEWGYLRLRAESYDESSIAAWAKSIRDTSWNSSYVFFKHEQLGPAFAQRLQAHFP